ncbi:hypothetical protein CC86DRAFT_406730 [Ophiobolus disseminans]|uniref:Uncharacterized protein n=1 Tax=Ophiobolus disseminans TaxID=1469910 RepID=A0A6A7A1N9_9PLEO|nr:hypothetical protein CC86DRAFT_406730 [Ophiobolus disseminans]
MDITEDDAAPDSELNAEEVTDFDTMFDTTMMEQIDNVARQLGSDGYLEDEGEDADADISQGMQARIERRNEALNGSAQIAADTIQQSIEDTAAERQMDDSGRVGQRDEMRMQQTELRMPLPFAPSVSSGQLRRSPRGLIRAGKIERALPPELQRIRKELGERLAKDNLDDSKELDTTMDMQRQFLEDSATIPSQLWRIPGRVRGQLKLNMDRILTDYILFDEVVDDINEMLDRIHNWPRRVVGGILRSFCEDVEEKGRKKVHVCLSQTDDGHEFNVAILNPNPLFPPARNTAAGWNPNYMPRSHIKGCGPECPWTIRRDNNKERMIRAQARREREKALVKVGDVGPPSMGAISMTLAQKLDRMVMPPPPPRPRQIPSSFAQSPPSPRPRHTQLPGSSLLSSPSPRPGRATLPARSNSTALLLNAANLSKIPDATIQPYRFMPDPNSQESSRSATPSPPVIPEPDPRAELKYMSVTDVNKYRNNFFVKSLPSPESSKREENTSLIPQRVARKQPKRLKNKHPKVEKYQVARKQPKQLKKQHPKVEEYQVDPDGH